MDETKMFQDVKQLCLCCGVSIEKISQECGINQNLVAKMFMETMQTILNKCKDN